MDVGTASKEACGRRFPASLAQTRFWLLDELNPGTPALNVAVRWTVLGQLTRGAVEAAWRQIVARHEILRTALLSEQGVPVQSVHSAVALRLQFYDLSHLDAAERLAAADRLGEDEARTPFVLEMAPLMRVTLIALEPGVSRLLLTLHHAVCDGWSIGLLADEFTAALTGGALAELPLQYGDYALWQQAWLNSPALRDATAYWTRQLAALPYLSVPPDHPAAERGDGAIVSVLLPRALTDQLAATAIEHGCTPFAVALAALARVLQARTGAADIAIGTQIAGRHAVELEAMVGCFINTLVLRLDLSGARDWAALVDRAAATVADALEHGEMPFEELIRVLNPPREPQRTPLFSVNLIFQRSFVAPPDRGGIQLVDMPSHSAGTLYDLNFFMVERPDGWRASCEYDTALFNLATVEAMLADWTQAIGGQAIGGHTIGGQAIGRAADELTQHLAAIWCETLAVDAVRAEDSFFDLGGHSLLAARLLAKVEAVFGRRLGLAALFADPTLAAMARQLRDNPTGSPLLLNANGRGTAVVALGEGCDWRQVSQELGPEHAVLCAGGAPISDLGPLKTKNVLAVMGSGAQAIAARDLAQTLRNRGQTVTLVLIDALPPRPAGLWSKLRRPAAPQFAGQTIVFHTRQDGKAAKGWDAHVAGPLELVTLAEGSREPFVAGYLRARWGD